MAPASQVIYARIPVELHRRVTEAALAAQVSYAVVVKVALTDLLRRVDGGERLTTGLVGPD